MERDERERLDELGRPSGVKPHKTEGDVLATVLVEKAELQRALAQARIDRDAAIELADLNAADRAKASAELAKARTTLEALGADDRLARLRDVVEENGMLRAEIEKLRQREPTATEMEAVLGADSEAFMTFGVGGTIRRCRHCRAPVFGGPTACVPCAEQYAAHAIVAAMQEELARAAAAQLAAERRESDWRRAAAEAAERARDSVSDEATIARALLGVAAVRLRRLNGAAPADPIMAGINTFLSATPARMPDAAQLGRTLGELAWGLADCLRFANESSKAVGVERIRWMLAAVVDECANIADIHATEQRALPGSTTDFEVRAGGDAIRETFMDKGGH